MRRSVLIFVMIAVIAALAPAAGAVPGSATARVVNALADRAIDVYVDGAPAVAGTAALSTAEPAVVAAGSVEVAFRTAGADPLSVPTAQRTVTVASGDDLLIVAHELDDGSFTITPIVTATPFILELSQTFTDVVHAAQAPALEVTELEGGFIVPSEGFVLESGEHAGTQFSWIGTNRFQFVDPTGPTTVFGPASVEIVAGSYTAVILAGSQDDGTLAIITVEIGGLWDTTVYSAQLTGAAEEPPVATSDRGRVGFERIGDELWYTITLQPGAASQVVAAHIHAGNPGENGPVLATLFAAVSPATGGGRIVQGLLTDADLAPVAAAGFDGNFETLLRRLAAGATYVNMHTVAYPAGEVRGQIEPLVIPMEPALFPDIESSVHRRNVSIIATAGIALGKVDGTFGVNEEVTRGQLATFIGRTLGLDEVAGSTFPDTAGSVHEGYINAVANLGIVLGRTDGTFGPNDPVTRGQAAAMIARTIGAGGADPGHPFTDIAGSTFEDVISSLWRMEVFTGCTPTTFCPNDNLTRGQMAAVLSRAFGWEVLLNLV